MWGKSILKRYECLGLVAPLETVSVTVCVYSRAVQKYTFVIKSRGGPLELFQFMKKLQKNFQPDWLRIGRVNPLFYFGGGVSRGCQFTKKA